MGWRNMLRMILSGAFWAGLCVSAQAAEPFPAPGLVALKGTVFEANTTPKLNWEDVAGAVSYTLEYATDPDFTHSTVVKGIPLSQYVLGQSGGPSADGMLSLRPWPKTYYWRVKAVGKGIESEYSPADHFVIESKLPGWPVILLALVLIGYMVWQVLA